MRVTARELAATHRPRPRRERDVQRAILEALKVLPGVVAWKTGGGLLPVNGRRVRMGHTGVSDLIGWRTVTGNAGWPKYEPLRVAQLIAIEVKAKGKKPSDAQRAFLDAVQAAGGIAVVAYSVDDVLQALR